MNKNLKLAENLKLFRSKLKLTQSEVADIINKDRTSVAKYEKGAAQPPFSVLCILAKLYDVTIDELCGFAGTAPLAVKSNSKEDELLETLVSGLNRQEQMMILKFKVMDKKKKQELLKIFEELSKQ